jgi:hypothetical protein
MIGYLRLPQTISLSFSDLDPTDNLDHTNGASLPAVQRDSFRFDQRHPGLCNMSNPSCQLARRVVLRPALS